MKKLPNWIKAIPISTAHGSGVLQKKLWRLTSDYVRIRDYYKYGYCVATGAKIASWRDANAGHYISYSVCRGIFKFSEKNIHAQSATSNSWGGMEIGHAFGEELKRRKINPNKLKAENRDTGLKINDTMVIEKMKDLLSKMKNLPEQPEYFNRVMTLHD